MQTGVSRWSMLQKRKQRRQQWDSRLDSVFITSTIDAKESRKVATIDIPGAFLHADNEDYVIMKLVGTLAELMVKTNPKMYRQYVILEKGKSMLYLRPQKTLWHDEERAAIL